MKELNTIRQNYTESVIGLHSRLDKVISRIINVLNYDNVKSFIFGILRFLHFIKLVMFVYFNKQYKFQQLIF